jgi:cell division protein ZapD
MAETTNIFEQPLNERIRLFLRFETLLKRLHYFTPLKGEWSAYTAVLGILEITNLIERGELKQELIRELERQFNALKSLSNNEDVDSTRLERTLEKQKSAIDGIHQLKGKLGSHIKEVDFLLSIKQRNTVPGGTCTFDLPELRFWLNQNHQNHEDNLNRWAKPYFQLESAIDLVLTVIRDSAAPTKCTAEAGFFQQPLDSNQPIQMLCIHLPQDSAVYPEISAGKHRYSIRFMQQEPIDSMPHQVQTDIKFMLSHCSI